MKNRKNVLIVFAILAILCLGIGYAALTDTLTLTGTVKGDAFNEENEALFDVDWVGTPDVTKSDNVTATAQIINSANDTASITVSDMKIKDQEVRIVFQVKNVICPDGYKASVEVVDGNTNKENLTISAGFAASEEATSFNNTTTLTKSATTYFIVTIKLDKTLATDADKVNCTLNYTLKATAVAE